MGKTEEKMMLCLLTKHTNTGMRIILQVLLIADLGSSLLWQVLWEMLTREIPFKGLEGLQVAWLVVEKHEVCV